MTREEWFTLAAATAETLHRLNLPPVRWAPGYPPGTRGRGTAHVLPPARSRDGRSWEVYLNPELSASTELAALVLRIAAAVDNGTTADLPRPTGDWSTLPTLAAAAADIVAVVGEYPSDGLIAAEAKPQGTRMLKVECSTCGFLFRTTARHLAAIDNASPCPACHTAGTLKH